MPATVTVDATAATRLVAALAKQLPFAMATAANDLAFQVQRAEAAAMLSTFKHPRPFTARSVQVDKATKTAPTATVFVRPEVAKYLQPYETGGLHVLPGPMLLAPVDITLDQYGQLPKATMAKLKARHDIYIGPIATKGGGVINGVWQRLAIARTGRARRHRNAGGGIFDKAQGALKLLIRFGKPVAVTKSLGFHARGTAIVLAQAASAFTNAISKALSTAR